MHIMTKDGWRLLGGPMAPAPTPPPVPGWDAHLQAFEKLFVRKDPVTGAEIEDYRDRWYREGRLSREAARFNREAAFDAIHGFCDRCADAREDLHGV